MKFDLMIIGLFFFITNAYCEHTQRISAWKINQRQVPAYQNLQAINRAALENSPFTLERDRKREMFSLAASVILALAGLVLAERMINEKGEEDCEKEKSKDKDK